MTDEPETPDAPGPDAAQKPDGKRPGERIAKAIARAGLGSRREAEAWIEAGRVSLNGAKVSTAAVNVLPGDRVEVDGKPLPQRERTRLWLYHKPRGYVTTTHDPEGRETVFSILPKGMPRVMTIGRLDINTEGLLLLTNDGGLARVLELPETGWLRRYRVRAFGRAAPEALEALKDGVEIEGFSYGAIDAEIERQQNDNVWLRFGLREGKNREVKKVAEHLGLAVNRLIRISFGPFQLGALAEGEVEEVRPRTLKDQLGKRLAEEAGVDFESRAESVGEDAPRMTGGRGGARALPSVARPDLAGDRRGRSRLADPSQRVGRRAAVARPRDLAAPSSPGGETVERPKSTKRAAPIADRRGRAVKVERVERDHADGEPKRVHRRDKGAAERFGAAGRPERPRRSEGAKSGGRAFEKREGASRDDARPPRLPGEVRPPRVRPPREDGDRPHRARGEERPRREGERAERPRSPAPRSSEPRWRDEISSGARPARPPRPGDGRPQRDSGDERRRPRPFGKRSGDGSRAAGDDRPRPAGPRKREDGPVRPARAGAGSGDRPRRDERPAGGDRPRGAGRPGFAKAGDKPDGRPRGPGKPAGKPGGRPGGAPGGKRPGGGGKPGGGRPGGGRGGGADRRR